MQRKVVHLKTAVAALVVSAIAGCQSYRPAPLDDAAHATAWDSRTPSEPGVVDYARRLDAAHDRSAAAPVYDPSDGLTIREAEVVALFFNPHLRARRLKTRVAQAGAAEAGRWEDPVLQVDAERIIDSVAEPWVIGGLLNVTLPLSGRLALEKNLAISEAAVAQVDVLLEEQRVLTELNAAWAELALLDERVKLARSFVKDLEEMSSQAERLRAAGELDPLEAGLFRIERVRRDAELRGLEPQRREQELTVKSLMGLTPTSEVRLIPTIPPQVVPVDAAARRALVLERHPRLWLTRAEYEVAERTFELEVRRQFPDLTLGGGYARDEGTNRILGGLSLPIPVLNANRRAIAEARANREAARAFAEAAREDVVLSLARAEAALESARVKREVLERELAPLADEQVRAARALGRLGDVNTVIVFEALTRAQETRVELLEAVEREAAARNQINALLRPVHGIDPNVKETR